MHFFLWYTIFFHTIATRIRLSGYNLLGELYFEAKWNFKIFRIFFEKSMVVQYNFWIQFEVLLCLRPARVMPLKELFQTGCFVCNTLAIVQDCHTTTVRLSLDISRTWPRKWKIRLDLDSPRFSASNGIWISKIPRWEIIFEFDESYKSWIV
jgi:hypothetical protein